MTEFIANCTWLFAIAWRQHRGKTIVAVLLMLGGSAAAPAIAMALRSMTNSVVAQQATAAAVAGAVVALLAVVALTFSHFANVVYSELSELSVLDLELQLIALSNGSVGTGHHEQPDFVDRFTVVRRDIRRLRNALESLLALGGLGVAVTLTTVLLTQLNPALLLLLPMAVVPLVAGRRAERVLDRAKIESAEQSRLAEGLFRLTAHPGPGKELRVLGLGDELLKRHQQLWTLLSRRQVRAQTVAAALRAGGQVVFALGYLGGVLLVVRDAVAGGATVGDVVLSITLAAQVSQQVASAASLLQELHRTSSTLRHVRDMRATLAPANRLTADQPAPRRLTQGIRLVDVSFTYPGTDRPVLRGVNLTLRAGTTVAIVGENGAGKTSLIKLLCAFHEPTAGSILVDGTDLRRIAPEQWRARISAGFQDFVRFEFTAQEVVGLGDLPRIDAPEAVLAALDRAHATGVLEQLSRGLDTQLGASHAAGVELSGGQWQKLALGRAFMRDEPLLLVLDEPTAALDARAEHALFERYVEQARRTARETGAITVLVSHRFSTVRMADLIVVIADGGIAELGDHATLMRAGGTYARLYELQRAAYA